MQPDPHLLDQPDQAPPRKWPLYQKILFTLEILAWIVMPVALLFAFESWNGGVPLLLCACGTLIVLYTFFGPFLFGSTGAKQHVFAVLSGISFALALIGPLLVVQSWPLGREITALSAVLCLIISMASLIWATRRQSSPNAWSFFYYGIFLRALFWVLKGGGSVLAMLE